MLEVIIARGKSRNEPEMGPAPGINLAEFVIQIYTLCSRKV